MKLVKGCLGMVVLFVVFVIVCGIIGSNMKHSSSPSPSVPDAISTNTPAPDISVKPTPPLPPPAVVYNTPAPKPVVVVPPVPVVPPTPPAPDLNAQLHVAQSNVAAAQLDLTKAKDAVLVRLKQNADYQSASADLAAADAQVKTDRANSDPNLPMSSQNYLNAKSKVLKMERDAVASDTSVAATQQKLTQLTGVVSSINSQIAATPTSGTPVTLNNADLTTAVKAKLGNGFVDDVVYDTSRNGYTVSYTVHNSTDGTSRVFAPAMACMALDDTLKVFKASKARWQVVDYSAYIETQGVKRLWFTARYFSKTLARIDLETIDGPELLQAADAHTQDDTAKGFSDTSTAVGPDVGDTHVGPRGGVYHLSANGNKVYQKK